jgi:hypothetical protein
MLFVSENNQVQISKFAIWLSNLSILSVADECFSRYIPWLYIYMFIDMASGFSDYNGHPQYG